jgi:hypothetical protein
MTQQLDAVQGTVSSILSENARRFWDFQDKIVDGMNTYASGWFERRHVGTHAALEAAQRICKSQTPMEFVLEYQNWASGAAQRVMADGLACHEQFMATVGAVISPKEHPGDRQRPEQAQSHTSTTARPKAA